MSQTNETATINNKAVIKIEGHSELVSESTDCVALVVYKNKGHTGMFLSSICCFPLFNNDRSWTTTFQDDDND